MTVPAPGQCLPFFLMIKVIYACSRTLQNASNRKKGKTNSIIVPHTVCHTFWHFSFFFFSTGHKILKGIQENKLVYAYLQTVEWGLQHIAGALSSWRNIIKETPPLFISIFTSLSENSLKKKKKLFIYFVLWYSQLTMLCWFQVNSKGTQPYIHMYPFSFKLPSHPGCHKTSSSATQ